MKTYRDLADFIDRLLNDKLTSPYEIDGFESITLARKPGQKYWPIEIWRRKIIDVAAIQRPHVEGHWAHPDSYPYLEKLKDVLIYMDTHSDDEYSSMFGPEQRSNLRAHTMGRTDKDSHTPDDRELRKAFIELNSFIQSQVKIVWKTSLAGGLAVGFLAGWLTATYF